LVPRGDTDIGRVNTALGRINRGRTKTVNCWRARKWGINVADQAAVASFMILIIVSSTSCATGKNGGHGGNGAGESAQHESHHERLISGRCLGENHVFYARSLKVGAVAGSNARAGRRAHFAIGVKYNMQI